MGVELPIRTGLKELTLVNDEYAKKILDTVDGDATSGVASFVQNAEKLPLDAWALSREGGWEEEAKLRRKSVNTQRISDISHAAYSHVFEVIETAKRHGAQLEESESWKLLRKHKWDIAAAIPELGVSFDSRPMLREPDFGEREYNKAALLNEDRGYLKGAGDAPFRLSADFVSLIGESADKSPARLVEIVNRDGELERVIIQDCIRTFAAHDHRKRLEVFLNGAYQEFGNYSQGMAHVAALLLLTLPEDEVIVILRHLNLKVIPGHWKHMSDGFGANAYVFQELLVKFFPECYEHLRDKHKLYTEVYTRKWFCGLGLHCLDVELVYRFLRNLLSRGFEYLMAFGLSVVQHFQDQILETDNPGLLLELMALDQKAGVSRADQEAILALSEKADYSGDLGTEEELEVRRKELYDKHIGSRPKTVVELGEDDEECQMCDSGVARWVDDDDDGLLICDDCRVKCEAKGHSVSEW